MLLRRSLVVEDRLADRADDKRDLGPQAPDPSSSAISPSLLSLCDRRYAMPAKPGRAGARRAAFVASGMDEIHHSEQPTRRQFCFASERQSDSSRVLAERSAGCKHERRRFGSIAVAAIRAGGSAGGAWLRGVADWPGFLPPPHRTVHAVLPHTAHRRPSPPAFGRPRLTRQSRKGLGVTTSWSRLISPSWLREW